VGASAVLVIFAARAGGVLNLDRARFHELLEGTVLTRFF